MKQNLQESMAEQIGIRLRRLREASGKNIRELADEADVSEAGLDVAERGLRVPSLTLLVKVAVALGTTVGRIVDGEPS